MKKKLRVLLVLGFALSCFIGGVHPQSQQWILAQYRQLFEEEALRLISGRIEVDSIHIGSKIGGRVHKVLAEEGDKVAAKVPIVLLEQEEILAQIEEAQANLERVQANLDLLLAGTRHEDLTRANAVVAAHKAELELRQKGFRKEEIFEADAQLVAAKSKLDLAAKNLARAQKLFAKNIVQQKDLDREVMVYQTAHASYEVASQRLTLIKNGTRPEEITMAQARLAQVNADLTRLKNGARPEEIAAQRAAVKATKANLLRLKTQLKETEIASPLNAIVETIDLNPGDLVKPGQTLAVLNLEESSWIRCYLPEPLLGWVSVGMEIKISVDSYPGRTFLGIIRRINSEAEFTPRNIQTTEKRMELVFEMKIDILQDKELLRAGMYADIPIKKQNNPQKGE